MRAPRFDVLVVGSGPAGSSAALVLARGGARVAMVEKSSFPRDKACGDLIGPRGLQVMADLEIPMPPGPDVGDMLVVGPTGRRVRLPSADGLTYPGHGTAVTRKIFDALLRQSAVDAGVTAIAGRADAPLEHEGRWRGYRLSDGEEVRSDLVIGADGATSGVATAAGLVDARRVLWGFAVRTYVEQGVDLPAIVLWEPEPRRAFPGYGWIFPGSDGVANVGLGLGTRSDRTAGARAVRDLPAFLEHLGGLGLLTGPTPTSMPRLGGWLKMGMVGTVPAAGCVLLVGDAAGLVNPFQGEGIAQAMGSGRAAAEAVLAGPGHAAGHYRAWLAAQHLPFHRIAAAAQAGLVRRPRATAAVARLVTTVGGGDAVAGGWAVFWNELLDGAPPGRHRSVAAAVTRISGVVTSRTATARWFKAAMSEQEESELHR